MNFSLPLGAYLSAIRAGLYAYEAGAVAEALARGEREVALASWADTIGSATLLDAWLASVGLNHDGS